MIASPIPHLTEEEKRIFSKLDTYLKIQQFLEDMDYNLEEEGNTFYSPRMVLKHRKSTCIEGAIFAAACLYYNGQLPLLGQMIANNDKDDDHVLGLYKVDGLWGALSKSKYPGLGFREPIFRNMRELALSYFENYYSYEGEKSLIGYTRPVDLRIFDSKGWVTEENSVEYIADYLVGVKTTRIISKAAEERLRPVTPIMKESGEIWIRRKNAMDYLKNKFKKDSE